MLKTNFRKIQPCGINEKLKEPNIQLLDKKISAALASDKETLSTLLLYQKYFSPNNTPVDQSADLEPTLTNYYTPSDETKTAEIIGITLGMALTTYIAYKVGQRN